MSATIKRPGDRPADQLTLVCRLRKKTTGRAASLPAAGEVELENVSSEVVEIEVHSSPLQYLDLIVTNAASEVVSGWRYGESFSPLPEPYILTLSPGEKYVGPVGLLGNVPESRQLPGSYAVTAIYEYKGMRASSDPLHIVGLVEG